MSGAQVQLSQAQLIVQQYVQMKEEHDKKSKELKKLSEAIDSCEKNIVEICKRAQTRGIRVGEREIMVTVTHKEKALSTKEKRAELVKLFGGDQTKVDRILAIGDMKKRDNNPFFQVDIIEPQPFSTSVGFEHLK